MSDINKNVFYSPFQKRIFIFSKGLWQLRRVWVLWVIWSVSGIFYSRNVGRLHWERLALAPVEIFKPSVSFNVFHSSLQISVSFGQISHQEMFHQTSGVFWERTGKFDFSLQDVLIDSHGLIIWKRIYSDYHFIYQNTQTPPVYWLAVSFLQ